ncbi:bromodomain-containing protein DDB_G0270170-like [Anthonomus grandis grandis]|uniref:bromodomain-containing protein DDB_G0270170-like n=1 Tax=Anthonomus grandis grandis TaxID=2921223 RepID=UPI0021655203|nr:bromodomain-containing protein DDB_G0270170-like [Anthonomus grandis grandis]
MDKSGDYSGTQSPSKNPFNFPESCEGDSSFRISSCKDAGRPSLAAQEDFFPRESLGLLPETTLLRDSLTRQSLIFNINSNSESGILKGLPGHTFTRESLGILNLSGLDLERESLGIFNFDLNAIKGQNDAIFKDPNAYLPAAIKPENKVPNIVLSTVNNNSDSSNFSSINKAFLFSTSRNFPSTSSYSPAFSENISFNTKSLEDVSRIYSNSSRSYDTGSIDVKLDPLNEAFQFIPEINVVSLSDKFGSSEFASDIENLRNRIKSWPLVLNKNALLEDLIKKNNTNSFDEGCVCRGVEDNKYIVDSVFLETNNQSLACEEKSFNEERYLLDCTPQPEWGDWDSSKSADLQEAGEDILKKVDKLFDTPSAIITQKASNIKVNNNSANSICDNNISQNISKISRASQCSMEHFQSGGNLSQDISKISKCSNKSNAVELLKNLSDVIDEHDKLSVSKKKEAHHMLHCLANLFKESKSEEDHAEDSGHSSVDEQVENKENEDPNVYEALDLSCKSNSSKKIINSLSQSRSSLVNNPPPYSFNSSNHALIQNTSTKSNNSRSSNISVTSQNNSINSGKNESGARFTSIRRQNSLTQSKVNFNSNKLKKTSSTSMLMSRQPMRAVLPVEKMTKNDKSSPKSGAGTPEKTAANRFPLQSKKTSTPIQAPKLKPVAASTPASHGTSGTNTRPKLTRSFSYQSKPSTDTKSVTSSTSKSETVKPVRRNSIAENTSCTKKTSDGIEESPKRRRTYSSGKEPKILSTLSKIRQNILNSPYYTRKSAGGEKKPLELPTVTEKSARVSTNKS